MAQILFRLNVTQGSHVLPFVVKKVDLVLYPYDVIQLKNALQVSSEHFMYNYSRIVKGDNPFFPTVMLALTDEGQGECPFLKPEGCSVYENRPTDCRTYPLERAVARQVSRKGPREHYFLAHHDYCKGHEESQRYTVKEYIREQRLEQYNTYNEMWTDLDTIFRSNPWEGEGAGGPKQQLAFMVCYNIDRFRELVIAENLLDQFKIARDRKRAIVRSDEELLKFGFDWLKLIFTGRSSLTKK